MNNPVQPESEDQWRECHERVDSYLLAHGLNDPERRHQIVTVVLHQARAQHLLDRSQSCLATTFSVLEAEMARWFRQIPALDAIPDQALLVTGRLFWRLGHPDHRWSNQFLSRETRSGELSSRLATLDSLWPPDLNISVMIPREPPVAREEPTDPSPPASWNPLLVALATFLVAAATLWQLL
jgi:hypothetical protein